MVVFWLGGQLPPLAPPLATAMVYLYTIREREDITYLVAWYNWFTKIKIPYDFFSYPISRLEQREFSNCALVTGNVIHICKRAEIWYFALPQINIPIYYNCIHGSTNFPPISSHWTFISPNTRISQKASFQNPSWNLVYSTWVLQNEQHKIGS